MKNFEPQRHATMDDTISNRVGVGANALVGGWQAMLASLLNQLKPYLKMSRIITFAQLTVEEKAVFEGLYPKIHLPECVSGVYISPSARNQMMYTNHGRKIPEEAIASPDNGVLLFCNPESDDTLVNALLAHPPYTASVDVYHRGGLLAGYVYNTIDDCIAALGDVVRTHLGRCD
jgi:hypothetical protein